jgi:multiple sugar transport system ATP-binding protein
MNTFRTNLILENGKYYVTPFGAKIEVDGETGRLLAEKQVAPGEVILGVRPEHINLAPAAAENTINGTVLVNEMMGSELHLHIATGDSKLVARIPTVDLSHEERKQLKNHFPAHLTFPGKVMYFFDPETEKNLLY